MHKDHVIRGDRCVWHRCCANVTRWRARRRLWLALHRRYERTASEVNGQGRKAEKESHAFLGHKKKSRFSSGMFILSLQTNLPNES